MKISIETILHKDQRYPSCGDYYYDKDGVLQIRVSKMSNKFYEYLIIIHELIEHVLIEAAHITHEEIDKFDMEFDGDGEPGDDPYAPYYHQHQIATGHEHLLATELNVNWQKYSEEVESL